jgi:CheY-like chemotaxis protein
MTKNLRILLVDDDETDRELFRTALEMASGNYQLAEAEHGEAALSLLEESKELPHIIILDLNMPVKDGRETLKEIKSHPEYKTIPVCIMSTSSAHFDIMNAYQQGANFFLMKPFGFDELKDMTGSLLRLFQKYIFLPEGLKAGG